MGGYSIFLAIVSVVYALTIISTVIVVISENRNPTKTVAWILILFFLPAIGLAFYFIFGQSNKKKTDIADSYKRFAKELEDSMSGIDYESVLNRERNKSKVLPKYLVLVNMLEKCTESFLQYGSDVEVIIDGKRKFNALVNDLENAKHHIHMEYFYFKKDDAGKKIKEILMRKAAEGVKVRFLYENVANIIVSPKYYYEMRQTGVEVVPFSKISLPWIRRVINYRNHRKVVVIDGEIGYTGGMNIGNEYVEGWRDTHLRIIGQGVYSLQANFLYDWYNSGEKPIEDNIRYFPQCEDYSENLLQIAPGVPDAQWQNLLLATVNLIANATKYVFIQTPYFIPTESIFEALQTAALGGVDVRLMLSKKTDTFFLDPAAHSYYEALLRSGVKIYEHQEVFIHAKTMVVDDYVSVIGSANMDFRSLELSFEINTYMYDADIAAKNREIFFDDLKCCKEIILEEWLKRPWIKKVIESVMRLFAPLL